jgi:tetrahydromethanopterin S-methyltransferase subunit G
MTNVTAEDYKNRLIKKMDEVDADISNTEIEFYGLIAERSRILSSFFRWLPSMKKSLAQIDKRLDELDEKRDEKRHVKLKIIASIREKLRSIP